MCIRDRAKAKLNDVAHMLKGMEKLAEEFSSDPEQVLPEAGPLESARACLLYTSLAGKSSIS